MGNNISLFSGYEQRENRTTNYCLLIMKLLYEENPKLLGEALDILVGNESIGQSIGVRFEQQLKSINSIPDGVIFQSAFTLFIETKNFDWFYDDQLENHLKGLSENYTGLKVLLALGNIEGDLDERFRKIIQITKDKYKNNIVFSAVTFEDFLDAIKSLNISKRLTDHLNELEFYLDSNGLLPRWSQILDVVNCAGMPEEILDDHVYICPASGGAYSHARCAYFGMYKEKHVSKIAAIRAVVDVNSHEDVKINWINIPSDKKVIEIESIKAVQKLRPGYPWRVFLLDVLHDTNFVKDSYGGMINSKRYFNISSLQPKDASDLAQKLLSKKWSEFVE